MANPNTQTGMITAGQAARLLCLTHERLRQLARNGWIPTAVKGKYPLVAVVQGYIRFLKDEERRAARSKADSALKSARRREIELRIADREARLIELSDVDAIAALHVRTYRDELAPVPAKATRDPAMRRLIAQALTVAVDRFEARYQEAREAWLAGQDPLDA